MSKDSRIRKEGYEAFMPYEGNPWQYCPYDDPSVWNYRGLQDLWMSGWKQAEEEFKERMLEVEAEEEEWRHFSTTCPWNDIDGLCIAVTLTLSFNDAPHVHENGGCEKDQCGLWHLKEYPQ